MEGFLGQIYYFGGNFAPRNFSYCEGQLLPISQWTALFSILGTTFGGDARTTFGLPDIRGRFVVGQGTSSADPYSFSSGEKGGSTTITLSASQMPSHTHTAALVVSGVTGNSTSPIEGGSLSATPPSGPFAGWIYTAGEPENPVTLSTESIAVESAGSSQPISIMPAYLGIPAVICVAGLYPSRN